MANLHLKTLNVNGLNNAVKRRAVFNLLRAKRGDAFFLQETHSTEKTGGMWKSEWGGDIAFAHGTSNARGVAVLIPRGATLKILSTLADAEGRFLIIQVEHDNVKYTMENVYAPTADKPDSQMSFLDAVDEHIQDMDPVNIIIGGDLNHCLDPNMDKFVRKNAKVPLEYSHCQKIGKRIISLMEDFHLSDAWRMVNPRTRHFTFRRRAYASRLDYWLISDHLTECLHASEISQVALSDHAMVSISLRSIQEQRGPGCWRFDCTLLHSQLFVAAMSKFLQEHGPDPDSSSPQADWDFLKYEIRKFTREYVQKEQSRTKVRVAELKKIMSMKGVDSIEDSDAEEEFLAAKRELAELELMKANRTILRARANWASQGERPTKYFLNLEKRKSRNRTISQVFDDDGNLTPNPKKILETTKSFFSRLYGGVPMDPDKVDGLDWDGINIPQISEDERNSLEEPYSEQELYKALKKMNLGKCPGSDGIPVEFYLRFWDLIKMPLMNSLHQGIMQGELSTEQKRGIITLIPKKDEDRRKVENWRPITLLNIDYKIFTKAMSLRLQPVLGNIIHPDQAGFLPKRNIGENLRTIQDVIDYTESVSQHALLVALDFRKAFDSIEWSFIYRAFQEFGFSPNFIDSIRTIFANTQSCTTNAGFTSDYFSPTHGVRQGCCVAPYLFLVAVEILGLQIRQDQRVEGVSVGGSTVKVSQFADDLTAFVKDKRSARTLLQIIESFGSFSGLKLNRNKSKLVALGPPSHEIFSDLGITTTTKVKILDIWFAAQRTPYQHYDWNYRENLDRIRKICHSWNNRNLSLKGKAVIVNSLLISILQYAGSYSECPKQVYHKFKKIVTHFLWGGRSAKIAYSTLIQGIEEGGIRLADLELRPQTARLLWVQRLARQPNYFSKEYLMFLTNGIPLNILIHSNVGPLPEGLERSPFYLEVF